MRDRRVPISGRVSSEKRANPTQETLVGLVAIVYCLDPKLGSFRVAVQVRTLGKLLDD
jgi:hypothetical protein